MNLLFRVIFASNCKSTHHKMALDALRYLRGDDAEAWQKLFLRHYAVYLEGAKAPDTHFKDFRNHVLHVRDDYWGGAVRTARKWYDKLVQALRNQDWHEAVYAAGVLSHDYTDPIHPFHTGQSQKESNVHRAVEWSITKSYDDLRSIAEQSGNYRDVPVPNGDEWLAEMVRAGDYSNRFYETLIEHYDFRRGVKDPPTGLDPTARECVAELIGYATIGTARILERAFVEAGATPPNADISLRGFLATLQIPIFWVTKKMADSRERAMVKAMYDELQATGVVDRTLTEDDRIVRDLHAAEVSRPLAANSPDGSAKHSTADRSTTEPTVTRPKLPSATTGHQPHRSASIRFYLEFASDVEEAPSIGPKTASRLAAVGVRSVQDLLNQQPQAPWRKLEVRYITPQTIRDWQSQALLASSIPRLRGHDAQILVACGYREPSSVAAADAGSLLHQALTFVDTSDGQRVIRSGKKPDLDEVQNWIRWAQQARSLHAA